MRISQGHPNLPARLDPMCEEVGGNGRPINTCEVPDGLRITHLSVMRNLASGQRKQLRQEEIASRQLRGVSWHTVAIHDGTPASTFERPTPRWLRSQPLRLIYSWIVAWDLSRECDILLMRHSPFDLPGMLMSFLVRNRVSVHHSKEVQELPLIRPGALGRSLAIVERIAGAWIIRRARGVLGVTREIAAYEVERAGRPTMPKDIYPNTVVTDEVKCIDDNRSADRVEAAFICANFTAWHGLDVLLDDAAQSASSALPGLRIHLIGNLDESLRRRVQSAPRGLFEMHGHLSEERYRSVVSTCDVGIGSLALHRQGMSEGSTLKMCEMLAMGLPVYTAAPDVVLPEDFPYCRVDRGPSLAAVRAFGDSMKSTPRASVRGAAIPFIEKANWMRHAAAFLGTLAGPGNYRGRSIAGRAEAENAAD